MRSPQPFAMAISPDDQNDKELLSRLSQPESYNVKTNLCNFEIEAKTVKNPSLVAKTQLCIMDFRPRPKAIYSTSKNLGILDFMPSPKAKCSTTKNLAVMNFKPRPKANCSTTKNLGKLEIKSVKKK